MEENLKFVKLHCSFVDLLNISLISTASSVTSSDSCSMYAFAVAREHMLSIGHLVHEKRRWPSCPQKHDQRCAGVASVASQ